MDLNLAAVVFMGAYVLAIIAAGLFMTLRPGGVVIKFAGTQPASETAGQRNEILLGGQTEAFGNPDGRVQAVLVGGVSPQVLALALSRGFGLLDDRHVPPGVILEADGHLVHLVEFWSEQTLDGPPAEAVPLRQDMAVLSADRKRLGKLRLVCFDRDSRAITALGVARRRSAPSVRLLPMDRVKAAGPHGIVSEVSVGQWVELKPYATDWAIQQAVQERLATDPVLQPFQRSLNVDVRDQQVRLSGYVADRAQADRAAQLASSVPGALRVDQGIANDDDLALAVSRAINDDARTAAAKVQVRSRLGLVELIGSAPDPATVRAIDEVASRVPGVQAVHNLTTVAGPT